MTNLADFFEEFRMTINSQSSMNSRGTTEEFMYYMTDELIDAGEIDGFEYCFCVKPKQSQINGYYYTDDDILCLFVADYEDSNELKNINKTETEKIVKKAIRFYTECVKTDYYKGFEETSPEYKLGHHIHEYRKDITKVSVYLLSERNLSVRTKRAIEVKSNPDVDVHIWDISRFAEMMKSKGVREPLEISLPALIGSTIPCLAIGTGSNPDEKYYLMVMPGEALAKLYDTHGSRLLESNVRCFLQARGKVNKGIIETVRETPEMFFAYNNGISATAESVTTVVGEFGLSIDTIKEFQIVNGGQTTASLLYAKRKYKADLSKVSVQMKLSVVPRDKSEIVVPNISKYANTQNRIVVADFDSNHPFHITLERFSRKTIANPVAGNLYGSYWFYERSRGQYADAMQNKTPAEKKKFQAENPKSQVFTKTDLGKFENVWFDDPRQVNLGAQKNFAQFAQRITAEWDANQDKFNDVFYKQCIARAIVFKRAEILVKQQPWYGGYRANIVAYTLAVFAHKLKRQDGPEEFFQDVWKNQSVLPKLENEIVLMAKEVANSIMDGAGVSNVSEWCKKEGCWAKIKEDLEPWMR